MAVGDDRESVGEDGRNGAGMGYDVQGGGSDSYGLQE